MVTFYDINPDGSPKVPVLYLDTLKVTTIEQTAEETEARGGKGNAALIAWDYGKSINVTIEDALFSAKSMAIMFGNGQVAEYTGSGAYIMKTEQWTAQSTQDGNSKTVAKAAGWSDKYVAPDGKLYNKINPKFYAADNSPATGFIANATYFCSFDLKIDGAVIDISANSFPGTYYVTGDTFARSEATGDDEFFQFIIPKAKVQSENTITLEAEGDPSVFNMNLKVLRPADGVMMKLVKYNLVDGSAATELTSTLYHNHSLDVNNTSDATNTGISLGVKVGKTITIPRPVGSGSYSLSWSAGNGTTNVTIDEDNAENCVVTGVAAGTETITASWGEGASAATATYTVVITA